MRDGRGSLHKAIVRCVSQLDDVNVGAVAPKLCDLVPAMFIGQSDERLKVAAGFLREWLYSVLVGIHCENHQGRLHDVSVSV